MRFRELRRRVFCQFGDHLSRRLHQLSPPLTEHGSTQSGESATNQPLTDKNNTKKQYAQKQYKKIKGSKKSSRVTIEQSNTTVVCCQKTTPLRWWWYCCCCYCWRSLTYLVGCQRFEVEQHGGEASPTRPLGSASDFRVRDPAAWPQLVHYRLK